jgi:hypothetical protein
LPVAFDAEIQPILRRAFTASCALKTLPGAGHGVKVALRGCELCPKLKVILTLGCGLFKCVGRRAPVSIFGMHDAHPEQYFWMVWCLIVELQQVERESLSVTRRMASE